MHIHFNSLHIHLLFTTSAGKGLTYTIDILKGSIFLHTWNRFGIWKFTFSKKIWTDMVVMSLCGSI